jgi:aminoglycoside phosphotransferase (APT) family kinase protein
VIAKRARRRTAEVERIVHERILPRLGVRSLHWHGIVGQDEEYCWFFLEDAGEDRFLPEDRNHRALAGRWLAVLHTAAEGMETLAGLPDRGARDALERLREGRDRILANLGNPAVSEARESLRVILERYDVVESRWEECEAVCDEAPRTLVHGDFAKKNLRVRCHGEQSEILVFDWENAGFGFPGNDLSLVEPADYWSVVRERWPGMAGESLERLFRAGRLFRCLAAINWESKSLRLPAPELRSVHAYAGRLDSVVREAGWIP